MAKAKEDLIGNLRQLGQEDLAAKLTLARKALFDTRLRRAELKNPLELRKKRREVAKILTIMKEKEISGKASKSK
jgi:large subunit ribosomal protein L29